MSEKNQATFTESGDVEKPDSVESDLEQYGLEAETPNRETRIDRPEPETFGDSATVENDPELGNQSGLCRDVDEDQQQLDGETGAETLAGWER